MNDVQIIQRADMAKSPEAMLRLIIDVDLQGMLSNEFGVKDALMRRARTLLVTPEINIQEEVEEIKRIVRDLEEMGVTITRQLS